MFKFKRNNCYEYAAICRHEIDGMIEMLEEVKEISMSEKLNLKAKLLRAANTYTEYI